MAVWLLVAFCLVGRHPRPGSIGQRHFGRHGQGRNRRSRSRRIARSERDQTQAAPTTTKATAEGLFTFPELPPGTYTLTVTSPGFESYTQSGIIVEVGSTATVDAVLKVVRPATSVTVMSDASHLETESSDVGYTMSPQVLESLPLPFGGEIRNPLEFAALSPGFAGTMSNNPSSPPAGAFKLSGGQQGGGDILLDGATTELASANMQVTYNFSVEAVSEFKVMTNTFDAQFGSASGGVVNLVSKQGTNDFHGSAYDLLKNRVLDANSWLNDYQNAVFGPNVDN